MINIFYLFWDIKPMQFAKTSSKYYANGNLFELILTDQTGTIYYPNGRKPIFIKNRKLITSFY